MPIDEDFARTRPAPSRWSIVEIVAHLNDVDENVNQIRVTLMLREDMPILERYDQEAECLRKKFIERKLSSELSRFADIRRQSISSLAESRDWRMAPQECARRVGAIGNSLSSPSARRIVSFWYRRSFRSLQRQKCGVWRFRRFHTLHGQGKFFYACIGDSVPCLGCNYFGIVIWYRLGPWRLASLDSPR